MIVDLKKKLLEDARGCLEAGNFEAAVATLERVIRIARDDHAMVCNVHVTLGTHFLEEGDPRAMTHFQAALAIDPSNDRVRYRLGHAWLEAGKPADAVREFSLALEERPEESEYLRCMGVALAEDGRLPEAIIRLRAAARAKPDDPLTHKDLAQVLSVCNLFDEAEKHARAAVRLCPEEASFRDVLDEIKHLAAAMRSAAKVRKTAKVRRPRKI